MGRNRLASQRFQKRFQRLFLLSGEVEGMDLLRSAEECARRVSPAIVEGNDIVKGCRLSVAEIGSSFGDLA